MSGETEKAVSGWTVDTLKERHDELRRTDVRHREELRLAEERFVAERDRRLSEVAVEREKALKIKEEADAAALQLERTTRDYKDEKGNQLREQIGSERGLYATKNDLGALGDKMIAIIKPLSDYVTSQQGKSAGVEWTTGKIFATIFAVGVLGGLYFTSQGQRRLPAPAAPAPVVTVQTPAEPAP